MERGVGRWRGEEKRETKVERKTDSEREKKQKKTEGAGRERNIGERGRDKESQSGVRKEVNACSI